MLIVFSLYGLIRTRSNKDISEVGHSLSKNVNFEFGRFEIE